MNFDLRNRKQTPAPVKNVKNALDSLLLGGGDKTEAKKVEYVGKRRKA